MNIFVLDTNTRLCAQYHNDKHVIKMILESSQMLSTANRSVGLDEGYKATHVNHPCNVWLRESIANWFWLVSLANQLHEEWRFRYDHPSTKNHKSWEVIESLTFPVKLPDVPMTPFALAMPDKYKSDNAVEAYRNYYIGDKAHIATWKKRGQPEWFK